MIPIMMYTSKGGEVYLGEARALGAVGVLPKEVKHADLIKALESLNLLTPNQSNAANEPVPDTDIFASAAGSTADTQRIVKLARQAAEDAIQQLLKSELEAQRIQLRHDIREAMQEIPASHTEHGPAETDLDGEYPPQTELPVRNRKRRGLGLAALVLIAAPLGYYYLRAPGGLTAAPPATADATDDATETEATPAPLNAHNTNLLRQLALQRVRYENQRTTLLKTLEWSLNRNAPYEFGELPFGDERLTLLSQLVSDLTTAGFEGVLRLESHVGQFCLARTAADEYRLAPDNTPLTECDFLGRDREHAVALGNGQSLAFANFISSSPLLHGGKIRVEIVSHGVDEPLHDYPPQNSTLKANQWNTIAARNNRVDTMIIPSH
jgi:hypothetical protein